MLLAAQLRRSSLGDILGHLHRARASGVLVLEESEHRVHAIHIVDGSPRAVASKGPRLGELLAERGAVALEDVREAVELQRAGDDRLFGEVLCGLGSTEDLVETTLARQTRARLEPLYDLGDARVRFHAALFPEVAPRAWVRAARRARSLSPRDFLHDRRRARSRDHGLEDERRDAFRLLGIEPTSDRTLLRDAFRRRVIELHPDLARTEEDRVSRTRALARLTAAYQRIGATSQP